MSLDILNLSAEEFVRSVDSGDAVKEAETYGMFIAEKLREHGFARGITAPHTVTRYDLQRDEDHDQLYFIGEKEVRTAPCKAINFKAAPDGNYLSTPRYRINIFEIASEIHEKKEIELLAINQPVFKLIEEHTIREMEEVEDSYFLSYTDAAAAASGNLVTYSTGTGGALTMGAVKAGVKLIDRYRLISKTVLMPRVLFDDFLTLTYQDVGSDLLKEIFVDGYKYYTMGGFKLIVSIKDELFRHPSLTLANGDPARMIYVYTEEKALGQFISFRTPQFAARRVYNVIGFGGWEYIGMGIANANGCARVTLVD